MKKIICIYFVLTCFLGSAQQNNLVNQEFTWSGVVSVSPWQKIFITNSFYFLSDSTCIYNRNHYDTTGLYMDTLDYKLNSDTINFAPLIFNETSRQEFASMKIIRDKYGVIVILRRINHFAGLPPLKRWKKKKKLTDYNKT